MSIALPFEILTPNGWKSPKDLQENVFVACVTDGKVCFKAIRQLLIYPSKFLFTTFTDGDFTVSLCHGNVKSMECIKPLASPSIFLHHCKEKETDEYCPDPVMECFATAEKIDSLQIQALAEGRPTIVEHLNDQLRISTVESMHWYPLQQNYLHTDAVSISCFEQEKTILVARLAAFTENIYKTKCVLI